MQKYNHQQIEKKWQDYWQAKKIFIAKDFSKKPKKYILVEFPYPSGEGLHMGHLRPYTAGDVYSRFMRLKGHNVMYPVGWDAFGLPAENFAIKMGVHPSVSTAKNIKNAKRQIQSWGLSFDWSREINTADPEYYKWTQWIFLQFFKKGLAYEATGVINWCPKDKTGLANEEVIDGCCERCGTQVEKKELRQWYLRITAYAEKLLEGLKSLNKWLEAIKLQQENWIGKSMGAEIEFQIDTNYNYVLLHGFNGSSNGVFFPWLKRELERRDLKYYAPDLPNSGSPTEEEQVGFVLGSAKFDENTVLLGHSLGCVVAMKVLEKIKTKIAGLVLAGGFVEHNFKDRPRSFEKTFKWKFNFDKIRENTGFVTVLSDVYDYAIPAEQGRILAKELKGTLIHQEAQKSHFTNTQEPLILKNLMPSIKVFTTRPDTIFGATYMVLAPEHPIIQNLESRIQNLEEVKKYIEKAKNETDINRTAIGREKTGVELKGIKAVNPATKEEIPIWVADYVLWGYGTGAIMAVPAHDERDFEFAKKFNLPIKAVVYDPHLPPPHEGELEGVQAVYVENGILINSGKFTKMYCAEAIPKMAAEFGKLTIQYKLRDWVFSRQRYWGEPIPLIHCEDCGVVAVPEKDLPVKLPYLKKYKPTGTGQSPLADIKSWMEVKCPKCKKLAWRETNTMPNWAGSSWYWLRYADSKNKKEFASERKLKYWQPVDVYFGGMEHTTLHLLYSRFWNLFLHDQNLVTAKEPFALRKPHGIILAADGEKMSKSRGNVVNPDDIVKKFGADTLRMYELFLGPHEMTVSWNDQGVIGVRRFLERVWQWVIQNQNSSIRQAQDEKIKMQNVPTSNPSPSVGRGRGEVVADKVERALHKLIKKITEDIENFRFNTAVSAFMEFHNEIKDERVNKEYIRTFLILLYPFAPHLTEELHQILGGKRSLQLEEWPEYNSALVIDKEVEIVVQINGKVRGKVQMQAGSSEEQVKTKVLELDLVKKTLVQESIKRVVFVPDKLINLVI